MHNTPTVDNDGAATIEAMLTPLIKEHGYDLVRDHLEKLMGSGRWSDYQRVSSIAKNVAARLARPCPVCNRKGKAKDGSCINCGHKP